MANDLIPELIEEISKDFTKHLALPNNSRILFSGRFGKGKTTFLEEYFKEKSIYNTSGIAYNTFHLKPVNYSVASNEDIFRYLKYDIILEFIKKNYDPEEYDFSFRDVLPYYILKNPEKVIKGFIEYIPKVGKLVSDFFEKLKKLYDDIKTFKENSNNSASANQLSNFLEKIELDEYSLYENDGITKIIEKILLELKGEKEAEKSENILIIDDLDRIDPEHIFRLLNVFSAHFDSHYTIFGKENKFGFDRVVLVCDIDNIKNIFKNKYGADVDFNGYIDKFYSKEIFWFTNYRKLIEATFKIFSTVKIKIGYYNYGTGSNMWSLMHLVAPLISHNILSFRTVELIRNYSIQFDDEIILHNQILININRIPLIAELKFFLKLFGSESTLIAAISKLEEINSPIEHRESKIRNLLYFYTYRYHQFKNYTNQGEIEVNDIFERQALVKIKSQDYTFSDMEITNYNIGLAEPKHYYRLLLKIIDDLISQKAL